MMKIYNYSVANYFVFWAVAHLRRFLEAYCFEYDVITVKVDPLHCS